MIEKIQDNLESIKEGEMVSEGVVSTALKAGFKVGQKILTKSAPKAAKVLSNPSVRKGSTVVTKKVIRSKAFRKFMKTMSTGKIGNVVKTISRSSIGKKLVGKPEKIVNAAILLYDLIKDFSSGEYKDASMETAAKGATTLVYIDSPEQVTQGDPEVDQKIVEENIAALEAELEKYKAWKEAQAKVNNESVETPSRKLLFEDTQTFKVYFNIILESAENDSEKLAKIKEVDPKFADELKKSVQSNGTVKIAKEDGQKVKELVSKDQKYLNEIKSSNHKVDKENVEKILEQEEKVKSVTEEIFSKETLMSLIPFSTSPTAEDINLFFKALHAWKEGTYEFDENDTSELVSIGVDLGITTVSMIAGGAASLFTFGISMILAILGCATTIGYVIDSMTRIGRNFKARGTSKVDLKAAQAIA